MPNPLLQPPIPASKQVSSSDCLSWAPAGRVAKLFEPQSVDVWRLRLPQSAAVADSVGVFLSAEERHRASRFVFPHDRNQFTVMHGVLRILLGGILGKDAGELVFAANENGKPRLEGVACGLRFSISHARGLGLIAISPERELGVDAELERLDFPCADVAERFFSVEESRYLQSLSPERQRTAFFSAWARKEACVKARGASLGRLNEIDVGIEQSFRQGRIWNAEGRAGETLWLQDMEPGLGYAGAIAIEQPLGQPAPRIRCFDWEIGSEYAGLVSE